MVSGNSVSTNLAFEPSSIAWFERPTRMSRSAARFPKERPWELTSVKLAARAARRVKLYIFAVDVGCLGVAEGLYLAI